MATMTAQPSLNQIYGFISKVRRYPVSVSQLLNLAKDLRAPQEVIKFYERFSKDCIFDDPEELTGRSEQVEIMRQEEREMPPEAGSPDD